MARTPTPPEEVRLARQSAAHTSWANTTDRSARVAPSREAMRQRFLRECDGDPVRAEHALKAHFTRLQLASVRSRRLAKEARDAALAASLTETAEQAEAELQGLGGPDA